MKDAKNALADFGIDISEIKEDRQRRGGPVDRRICSCGHAVARHRTPTDPPVAWVEGLTEGFPCKPNGMDCRCKGPNPTLLVSDPRTFLRATTGEGAGHALIKGLSTMPEGSTYEWLQPLACFKCAAEGADKNIQPVPLTRAGKRTFNHKSEGSDRFLCMKCREEL
jgi:hypothetical protein